MKYGLREKRVDMGLFDFSVICIVGDFNNVQKYLDWKFEGYTQIPSNAPRGMTFFKRGYVPVIWIPRMPKTPTEHATLAHECIHAVYHLFEWVEMPLDRSTEEVQCHATAHLIRNILK